MGGGVERGGNGERISEDLRQVFAFRVGEGGGVYGFCGGEEDIP